MTKQKQKKKGLCLPISGFSVSKEKKNNGVTPKWWHPGRAFPPLATPLVRSKIKSIILVLAWTSRFKSSSFINAEIQITFFLGTCAVEARNYSSPIIQSASPCTYQCLVAYQCLPGYVSGVGSTYNAICSASGTLEPPEICICKYIYIWRIDFQLVFDWLQWGLGCKVELLSYSLLGLSSPKSVAILKLK